MWDWLQARYSFEALWTAWGAVFIGYAGFYILEHIIPAKRNPRRAELGADILANLIFVVLNPLAVFLGISLAQPIAAALGGPRFHLNLPTFAAGPVSSFFLAFLPMFVFDFFYYWFHRFQHRWLWLWQEHRLHHSESVLNVTTNFRHHWLEEFFRSFFIFLPMSWLIAIDPVPSALGAILIRQWSSFFHSNVRVHLGWFTPLIIGPQYHRIHHSIETGHIGKNYAAFFPIWDRLFNTYYKPARGEWPDVGLPETDGVWSFRELLLSPFLAWIRTGRKLLMETAIWILPNWP